ncbi:MAG: PDZ domain-containing protein [Akkermansiaceae bacterium]
MIRAVLGAVLGAGIASAQPPSLGPGEVLILRPKRALVALPERGEPWLGISVHKPSKAVHDALHEVPEGVGFVVQDVVVNGPADLAGMQKFDVLWKINDQLVVNEAQFLVILHLSGAGDSVSLTIQREGKNRELKATLGKRPTHQRGREATDVLVMDGPLIPGMPEQFAESLRHEASIKGGGGTQVRLVREDSGFHWDQIDAAGVVILEGEVQGVHDLHFPGGTNVKLSQMLRVLIRAVEDSEKRARTGVRPPRVRQVLPPSKNKVPNP